MAVERRELIRVLIGLGLIVLFIIMGFSLVTYDSHDRSDYPRNDPVHNQCGIVGALLSEMLLNAFGWVSLLLTVIVGACGAALVAGRWLERWKMQVTGAALMVVSAAALSYAIDISVGTDVEYAGGLIGWGVGSLLLGALRNGAFVLLIVTFIVGVMFFTQMLLYTLACAGARRLIARYRQARALRAEASAPDGKPRLMARGAAPRISKAPAAPAAGEKAETSETAEPVAKKPVIEKAPVVAKRDEDRRTLDQPPTRPPGKPTQYKLPPIELLEERQTGDSTESEDTVREKATVLERTLGEFGIEAQVVEIDRGPVITLYEIELAAGIKIGKVSGLSGDIARALKAQAVRVIAPIPGKSTVGVEVPNQQREIVRMRELIESGLLERKRMIIPLLLGKDSSGAPLVADLTQMPHILIAGATGSGKSVCINSLIVSMMMTQYPDTLNMILVDPKMVELAPYQDIPHLMCPVLTDMKKAASVLEWATVKMDERYELLAQTGCRNIAAYNKLGEKGIRERIRAEDDALLDDIPMHMPFIVIVVDELADLMMTAAKEAEYAITRLAQKSRAVGIHIIMATQRPSVDVITGLIKANLPCRIAFQTSSMVDSRTILDRNGAEALLGAGDLLFIPPGTSRVIRAQGTYTSDKEIRAVTDFWRAQGRPVFHTDLEQKKPIADRSPEERDELYEDAVRVVLMTQRGSVSLLQRKLEIGYSRAARLVDMMAEQGLLGGYKGSQAREVLVTLDDWEASRREESPAGASSEPEEDESPE